MKVWWRAKHQFFDLLMLVGLRDRLRCPKCKAVGTWKPHGGWCDRLHDFATAYQALKVAFAAGARYATNRRWLCKYCGYNVIETGEFQCYPNRKTKVWGLKDDFSAPTPQQRVEADGKVWPWNG